MYSNSTSNSPKNNNLQMFISQQSKHSKKQSNYEQVVVPQAKSQQQKKQNLISQLQNNQNQSMLFRLHQQQMSSNQQFAGASNDDGENDQIHQKKASMNYQAMNSNSINRAQPNVNNVGSSPPNKINRGINSNASTQMKNQTTFNQNRMIKQSMDGENYYSQQNYQKAPPIQMGAQSMMPTPNNKKIKKDSKSNMQQNLLGSQERLMNQYHTQKNAISNTQPRQSTSGTLHSSSKDNLVRHSMQKQQSATGKQVTGMSQKNNQVQNLSIQHPHFIKVKSKTNANPTRQSSPRFAQKQSIQHNRNQMRESNSSYHNQGSKKQQQKQTQLMMQSSKGYQVMSQPTSPNKDSIMMEKIQQNDQNNRIGYAASLIEQSMNINFIDPNQLQKTQQNLAQSVGGHGNMSAMSSNNGQGFKKSQKYKNITMDGNQQMIQTEVSSNNKSSSKPLKPQSSSNINYKTNPTSKEPDSGVRGSKQGGRHESASNYSNKQRLQSGNSSKNQQTYQNTMRRLNSPGNNLAMANKMAQISQIENIEQQQRKQLNQMVTKNIGGIASGSHRRENRNKMMKMQVQSNQIPGCKSVVGSMGSLSQFMGIDPHQSQQQELDYHQMKQMEYENKTQEPTNPQLQYSQLQQMHLNNVNPMFFSTGEVIPGSQQMVSFNKNQVVGNVGGMTMAIPPRQKQTNSNQGSMINFKQDHMDENVYNAQQNQYWVNLENSGGKQHAMMKNQQNNSNVQPQGPVQVKQSMIQMRKINPISKTAANGSQNTSFDQKMNVPKQGHPQTMKGYKQKGQFDIIQEHQIKNRPLAQTTKVSYNNSPQNRSKVNSINIPPSKMTQQKQQQIGQPMGDSIPLINQYYSYKNKDGKVVHQEMMNQGEVIKKQSAQVAQSMLIRETKANKRQYSGLPSQQSNQDHKYHDQLKQKGNNTNLSVERHTNNKMANHLANGGKLKLKIMSENNSPNANLPGPNQIQGTQLMNQYFMQNKHKYAQIDSPKDSSIERVRQFDIIGQESMINNNAQIEVKNFNPTEGNISQTTPHSTGNNTAANSKQQAEESPIAEKQEKKGKIVQTYIIDKIEKVNYDNLSPRSKEVFMIVQLIKNCFAKYNKAPKTQLELYKIGKMLGKGAFGKVNLGLHRLTRKLVAIKSINMDFMKEESQKKKIMNEINILKSLRHPNNIKILETFQTDKHHMIVMELCPGGDLLNYVRKRRKLSEKYAKFVFKQIMQGIAYLHANKVSHRDIKLDNILLDGHGNIKIGDFGVSRKIEENEILFEQCGTPAYIAPEIVKDMGYKGFPVDIWSAGICLYAMLYGNVPFKANQIGDLNTIEQLNQEIEYKKDVVSEKAIDLMKSMLQKSPQKRATAEDVLAHDWLNEELDQHIDIFDEQELELIRKEFTYVVQRKKLKDLAAQQEELKQGELPIYQQSRKPDDLNTEFTQCSLQTHENTLMKNDSVRSVILCPFNTQTGDKTADKILEQAANLMADKDLMIRFHPRVRELDRNYEKLNNQDFDNGVYHKYAYKQKGKKEDKKEELKEEEIRQSDVKMNNLVSDANNETLRRRKRQNADINYQNYYIKINHKIITDVVRLGFPKEFVEKQLRDNANNHCTTTYYLLCMDQNF